MKSFTTEKAMVLDQEMVERLIFTLESCQQSLDKVSELYIEAKADADANRLLTIKQACAYLGGCTETTLLNYRKMGLQYFKKGKDGVWYRRGDIDMWLASGRVSHLTRHRLPLLS